MGTYSFCLSTGHHSTKLVLSTLQTFLQRERLVSPHPWLATFSRSASLKVNLLEINILSDLGVNFTLKVAKASEAISNVDSSTYLKKSLN